MTCVGGTIFIEAHHILDESLPGLWVDVHVNSVYLTTVEFYDDSVPQPLGNYTLTYSNAAFVVGATVSLPGFGVSAICVAPTVATPLFAGKPLPAGANLVLFLGDEAILDNPNGNRIGLVMKTCKTEFLVAVSPNGKWGQLYQQGGWVSLANILDVPEAYGQPVFPIYPPCVGK